MTANTVTDREVLDFLGHAFRNIDLPRLSKDDLQDIAGGLARFSTCAPASHREGSEAATDAMIEAGAKAIYDLRKESACNGQRPAEWEELDDIWQEEERSFARAALTAMSGQSQPITRELAAMSSSKPIGAVADSASGSPLSGEPNGQAGADHASGSRSGEGSEAITDAMLQAGLKELDWYDGEKGEEVVEAVYTAMRQAALQSSPVPDGAITPEVGAALDHALRASTKLIETIPPRNADEVERVAQLLHYKETARNYGQQTADQIDWAEEPDSIREKYLNRAADAITAIRPSRDEMREAQLQEIASIIEYWVKWTERQHDGPVSPDTHVMLDGYDNCPPTWPSAGQLKCWAGVLRGAAMQGGRND